MEPSEVTKFVLPEAELSSGCLMAGGFERSIP